MKHLQLKKIGIIGGMGPESTILYYKFLVKAFYDKCKELGIGVGFPEVSIETVNMYKMLGYCKIGDDEGLFKYLSKAIDNIVKSKVDFIVLSSNTPHIIIHRLQEYSTVPIISIIDSVSIKLMEFNIKKIMWLGTGFTMNHKFFKTEFENHGFEFIVPNETERDYIDKKIADELEFGIVNKETMLKMNEIINRNIDENNIDCVVIGCTELPLIYKDEEFPVLCVDTTEEHIKIALQYMFGECPYLNFTAEMVN